MLQAASVLKSHLIVGSWEVQDHYEGLLIMTFTNSGFSDQMASNNNCLSLLMLNCDKISTPYGMGNFPEAAAVSNLFNGNPIDDEIPDKSLFSKKWL